MKNQGKDTPRNKKELREWLSRVGEPIAVLAMVHDEKHAQVISNVLQYAATRRADKSRRGKILGALEDRNKTGEDPPFVRLKPSYFEWRKVRLPVDREDSGPMATYYDQQENEGQFCPLEEGEVEANKTPVPKFTLVPAKIAADALEEGHTPWKVYDALTDFEEEKSEEVKNLLKPCKDWALAAALRGDNGAKTSKMAYILTPVMAVISMSREQRRPPYVTLLRFLVVSNSCLLLLQIRRGVFIAILPFANSISCLLMIECFHSTYQMRLPRSTFLGLEWGWWQSRKCRTIAFVRAITLCAFK